MKCDELKLYSQCYDGNDGLFYHQTEVDEAIAELKQKLEDAKASHYAEMVDAGMRERRLKRAFYKACANWAKVRQRAGYFSWTLWGKMKDRCLNKMEEYK